MELTNEFRAVVLPKVWKDGLRSRLEDYRNTADILIQHRAQYVHHLTENLPRRVANRIMDLSTELGDSASLYDIMNVFTGVANESVSYGMSLNLQSLGGRFPWVAPKRCAGPLPGVRSAVQPGIMIDLHFLVRLPPGRCDLPGDLDRRTATEEARTGPRSASQAAPAADPSDSCEVRCRKR